jgi:amidase
VNEELALLDATVQAELVRTGQVRPAELVTAAIERIEALNPVLNAVVTPVFERAAEEAQAGPTGPFAGVPYLVKDLAIEMKGVRFTEGSLLDRQRVGLRLRARAPAAPGGPGHPGQDQHAGVRDGAGLRAGAVRPGPQPVGHGAVHQRVQRRLGRGGGVGHGAVRARQRPGRLAAVPGVRVRPVRPQADPGAQPVRAEYGDVAAGGAVEHALTRSVRDSAALLDATSGPDLGDPYWAPPPARPFLAEVGADPGRLRIGYTTRTPEGDLGHPDCVAAAEHAAWLCSSLGHEVTETDWPGFTPEVGAAIGTMMGAAAAWVMRYWIRRVGREPGDGEIEPLNRALWQAGEQVTAAQWLLAVRDVQRFSRRVARFFTGFDAFLTPTMSSPPLLIGEMVSTPEDPWRSLQVSGQTVRYAGIVANLTGNPAMSVPLWWNDDGLPVGVHVLGRFGDEATLIRLAAQLEAAQPWAGRRPAVHAAGPREP